jgi:hypothetical protein
MVRQRHRTRISSDVDLITAFDRDACKDGDGLRERKMAKSNYPPGEWLNDCPTPNRNECLIEMRKRTSKVAAETLQRCGKKVPSFAKATEGTHFAFIHGFTPVAFCEGG